jgi:hypothetical protein
LINLLPEAVTQSEFVFVQPHSDTSTIEQLRQRAGYLLLILTGMTDENIGVVIAVYLAP